MRNNTLEVDGDGDKTLAIFEEPNDVKGTAFLNYTHKEGSDDQWLYLPALRRVKRIASNNKSGPFMGSEFAYEDISSQEVEKYTYEFIRTEDVEGTPMYVIARIPLDKRSGYTRQVVWYGQAEYRLQRVDYYDRKNELLKKLTYHDYTQHGVNPRGWTVGVGWIDRLRVSGCIHTLEFLRRPVAEGGVQASSIVYLLKEVGESVG